MVGSEEMVDNSLIFNLTATITSLMREHQGEFKCSAGGEKIYNVQVVGRCNHYVNSNFGNIDWPSICSRFC